MAAEHGDVRPAGFDWMSGAPGWVRLQLCAMVEHSHPAEGHPSADALPSAAASPARAIQDAPSSPGEPHAASPKSAFPSARGTRVGLLIPLGEEYLAIEQVLNAKRSFRSGDELLYELSTPAGTRSWPRLWAMRVRSTRRWWPND